MKNLSRLALLFAVCFPIQSMGQAMQMGQPMGGCQAYGGNMPAVPGASQSPTGAAASALNRYQCGTETQQVIGQIEQLKQMLSVKDNNKCQRIQERMNKNIPCLSQMINVAGSHAKAQELERMQKELADIQIKIDETPIGSPMGPPSPQIAALKQRKQMLSAKIDAMKMTLGYSETAVIFKTHEEFAKAADGFSNEIFDAFSNNCFENSDGTGTQAALSLAGMAGLLLGGSPFGQGLMAGSKLLKNLFDTDNSHNLENLDKEILSNRLPCALNTMSDSHCRLAKKQKLFDQITEANEAGKLCIGCAVEHRNKTDPLTKLSNFLGDLNSLPLTSDNAGINFSDLSAEIKKTVQDLAVLAEEEEITNLLNQTRQPFERPDAQRLREKIITANENLSKINSSELTFEEEPRAREDFMKSLQDLQTDFEGQKEFSKLVGVHAVNQAALAEELDLNLDSKTVIGLSFLPVYNLLSLPMQDITHIIGDQNTAFRASGKMIETFSKNFQNSAETAIKYIDTEGTKTEKALMCMAFLGMEPQNETARNSCDKAPDHQSIGGGTDAPKFDFSAFSKLPHEERVCIAQNFFECSNAYFSRSGQTDPGETHACKTYREKLAKARSLPDERESSERETASFQREESH